MSARSRRTALAGLALALSLGACATASPSPLPERPDLGPVPTLTVPASRLDLPGLAPRAIHPGRGLDRLDVVTLAVLRDPQLKADRLRAGVAEAQLVQAGLLPDPALDLSGARSATRTGYSVGLSEDLRPLFTRGARKAAAGAHASQVRLEILWEEWQVAERASELFAEARADQALRPVLTELQGLLEKRYRAAQAALAQGSVTASALAPELVALADVQARRRRLELEANRTHHQLDALLGLPPDAKPLLRDGPLPSPMAPARFRTALASVQKRRPDLLALRAGYQSAEARLRQAVVGQFPPVTVGVVQSRGVEGGVASLGLALRIRLPFFNGNRGHVALGRASRALLRQQYQARLDQAQSEGDQAWHATRILARELAALRARLPTLQATAASARRGYQQGTLDADAYVALASYALTEQADAIRLEASLRSAQSGLRLLLGLPLTSR